MKKTIATLLIMVLVLSVSITSFATDTSMSTMLDRLETGGTLLINETFSNSTNGFDDTTVWATFAKASVQTDGTLKCNNNPVSKTSVADSVIEFDYYGPGGGSDDDSFEINYDFRRLDANNYSRITIQKNKNGTSSVKYSEKVNNTSSYALTDIYNSRTNGLFNFSTATWYTYRIGVIGTTVYVQVKEKDAANFTDLAEFNSYTGMSTAAGVIQFYDSNKSNAKVGYLDNIKLYQIGIVLDVSIQEGRNIPVSTNTFTITDNFNSVTSAALEGKLKIFNNGKAVDYTLTDNEDGCVAVTIDDEMEAYSKYTVFVPAGTVFGSFKLSGDFTRNYYTVGNETCGEDFSTGQFVHFSNVVPKSTQNGIVTFNGTGTNLSLDSYKDFILEFDALRPANGSFTVFLRQIDGSNRGRIDVSNAGAVKFSYSGGTSPVSNYELAPNGTIVQENWYRFSISLAGNTIKLNIFNKATNENVVDTTYTNTNIVNQVGNVGLYVTTAGLQMSDLKIYDISCFNGSTTVALGNVIPLNFTIAPASLSGLIVNNGTANADYTLVQYSGKKYGILVPGVGSYEIDLSNITSIYGGSITNTVPLSNKIETAVVKSGSTWTVSVAERSETGKVIYALYDGVTAKSLKNAIIHTIGDKDYTLATFDVSGLTNPSVNVFFWSGLDTLSPLTEKFSHQ
jgi:hypothetical protein